MSLLAENERAESKTSKAEKKIHLQSKTKLAERLFGTGAKDLLYSQFAKCL